MLRNVLGGALMLGSYVGLAVLILWLVDRVRRPRLRSAEETTAAEVERRRRLLEPDWEGFARTYGTRPPSVLRRLYGDEALVTAWDVVVVAPSRGESKGREWEIGGFEPVAEEGPDLSSADAPPGSLAFARNGFGDPYYVVLRRLPDGDGPVFVAYHDGGDTEPVAPSLAEFLSWPRRARSGAPAA